VISKEEYRLEILHNTFAYVEPLGQALPAYNPNITGNEDKYAIKALKVEHKVYRTNRLRYEGLMEHIKDKLLKSVDETWLAALKRPRGDTQQCSKIEHDDGQKAQKGVEPDARHHHILQVHRGHSHETGQVGYLLFSSRHGYGGCRSND
jgi:hypothetical protein